jgi:peptidyl-dipeptidase Dcp
MANENPLLSPSTLPYQLPDYANIEPAHYLPAFEHAFAEHRREIDAITRVRSMPTFENTMVPLETSGRLLGDVSRTFYTVSSADATPAIQEIEETLAPLMSAHYDSIQLDTQLYWRIKTLHDQLDRLDLDPEQGYLVERHFREMTQAGAGLDDEAKSRLTEINQRLSTLTTTFE